MGLLSLQPVQHVPALAVLHDDVKPVAAGICTPHVRNVGDTAVATAAHILTLAPLQLLRYRALSLHTNCMGFGACHCGVTCQQPFAMTPAAVPIHNCWAGQERYKDISNRTVECLVHIWFATLCVNGNCSDACPGAAAGKVPGLTLVSSGT
jgi:hypothetical protein